jgi:hypothetical protein
MELNDIIAFVRGDILNMKLVTAEPQQPCPRSPCKCESTKWAGLFPDPWQERLLRSHSLRMLLLCSRQSGKSATAAALALRDALLYPMSLVLLLSPAGGVQIR